MSRISGAVGALVAAGVLLAGAAVRAQVAPADAAGRTVEERLREIEAANAALQNQVHALEQKVAAPVAAPPAEEPSSGEPFAFGDFTWLNGGSRQTHRILDTKYFTPQFDVDLNYTYSFNQPIDHTIVGSTATFRHNELELAFLGIGGDAHIGPARGRIFFQFGERAVGVPRNDVTINHGQYDLLAAMRYLSEAYAGYHWNKYHGINLDIGLFFSYVGLFSYTQYENWGYQASFTSDNTPWFFNGARLQIFPTDRLKVELWLINGWQTYGKFNELPGVGYQIRYAANESMNFVSNGYVGTDTQDHPGRVRFHSDSSFLLRYYNHPRSRGLSRGAFSVTFDIGFEEGDGVGAFHGQSKAHDSDPDLMCTTANPCEQDFVSGMAYDNLWFYRNTFSWMLGGGFIHNPGRYLVLV
ncbi:MAG TPA: outer membrane beta-barrel protein, partial [Polyangia bacterium]